MDSAEQLQRIYLEGFELQTFERYPKLIGVTKGNCVALLVPGLDGLQIMGTPGWHMGEVLGVLTEVGDRRGHARTNCGTGELSSGAESSTRSATLVGVHRAIQS